MPLIIFPDYIALPRQSVLSSFSRSVSSPTTPGSRCSGAASRVILRQNGIHARPLILSSYLHIQNIYHSSAVVIADHLLQLGEIVHPNAHTADVEVGKAVKSFRCKKTIIKEADSCVKALPVDFMKELKRMRSEHCAYKLIWRNVVVLGHIVINHRWRDIDEIIASLNHDGSIS